MARLRDAADENEESVFSLEYSIADVFVESLNRS